MASTNRTDKIKQLFKILQKRYKQPPKPVMRNVLDTLMFAACLENAAFEAAESAFSLLEHHYIDWNDIRIATPQELADTLPMLPEPLAAGERIKRTLQWVFETTYMFDLEDYKKKNISQALEYLDSIPCCSPFMRNYTIQMGFEGHMIPLDDAAMRIFRRLDLAKVSKEGDREEVPSLERTISKSQGILFATLMHLFALEFYPAPDSDELLTILKGIDPAVEKRSWAAPELQPRKPRPKLPPLAAPPVRGFTQEFDMDDDFDGADVGTVPEEATIDFIDPEIPLPKTEKDFTEKGGVTGTLFDLEDDTPATAKKSEKSASVSQSVSEEPRDTSEKGVSKQTSPKKVAEKSKSKPVPAKENAEKKTAEKSTKKTAAPKSGKEAAKDEKPSSSKDLKKETAPPKEEPPAEKPSSAKKLQQKKPR
ncbi:MAG: hypothetical protein LBQ54_09725 [Planctomycetaceae bacterium]|nr:hypothetical protein [Planctomycetaceae bacterium]